MFSTHNETWTTKPRPPVEYVAVRPVDRVFPFLAGNTPLRSELPRGCGLDTFLACQSEILLTLSVSPAGSRGNGGVGKAGERGKTGDQHRNRAQHKGHAATTSDCGGAGSSPGGVGGSGESVGRDRSWMLSGRAGEARLGLGQFRNGHVRKIELQAPLLLSGSGGHRSQLLLVKVRRGVGRSSH